MCIRDRVGTEFIHNLLRGNLTLLLGDLLDHVCKLLVHALWQLEAVEGIHHERYRCV